MTNIIIANTQKQRDLTHVFFSKYFAPLAPDAIPSADDTIFDSVILNYVEENKIIGALQIASPMIVFALKKNMPGSRMVKELDLVAVDEEHRLNGIGKLLILKAEAIEKAKGTKIIYGWVDIASKETKLDVFYEKLGYNIISGTEPLPEFYGKPWELGQSVTKFRFWKKL